MWYPFAPGCPICRLSPLADPSIAFTLATYRRVGHGNRGSPHVAVLHDAGVTAAEAGRAWRLSWAPARCATWRCDPLFASAPRRRPRRRHPTPEPPRPEAHAAPTAAEVPLSVAAICAKHAAGSVRLNAPSLGDGIGHAASAAQGAPRRPQGAARRDRADPAERRPVTAGPLDMRRPWCPNPGRIPCRQPPQDTP